MITPCHAQHYSFIPVFIFFFPPVNVTVVQNHRAPSLCCCAEQLIKLSLRSVCTHSVRQQAPQREEAFHSLLPCPLLCRSDGASNGKLTHPPNPTPPPTLPRSPALIKGSGRKEEHQAKRGGARSASPWEQRKWMQGDKIKVSSACRLG